VREPQGVAGCGVASECSERERERVREQQPAGCGERASECSERERERERVREQQPAGW
jgi:hypothetical protein